MYIEYRRKNFFCIHHYSPVNSILVQKFRAHFAGMSKNSKLFLVSKMEGFSNGPQTVNIAME